MQGFVMTGIGVGSAQSVDDPTSLRGEAIVAPLYSGLCGTDVHLFHEGMMLDEGDLPMVLGHEFVGRVVDANGSVTAGGVMLRDGDLVAAEPVLPCGQCHYCARGMLNLCLNWSHLGIVRDGCWAEFVAVPGQRLTVLPDGVDVRTAALAEPLACAVNFVLDRGEVSAGQTVLVLGAGPVGLLSAAVAKAAGAAAVIVSEPQSGRRDRARAVGADVVVDPLEEDLAMIARDLTGGVGADVIIEVTGAAPAIAQSIDIAAPGSRVVLAGLGGGSRVPIDTNALAIKQLDVRGGFASRWAMPRGLAMLAKGVLRVDSLITSEHSWADAELAMHDMVHHPDTCKIVLTAPTQ